MSENIVLVTKDELNQQPIPTEWRSQLIQIVEAIGTNDFSLIDASFTIRSITQSDRIRISQNIEDYGCELISLPDETWKTSACQWMRGYWDVLVDLYTVEEGRSDLILSVRVYEQDSGFQFEVMSVHVE